MESRPKRRSGVSANTSDKGTQATSAVSSRTCSKISGGMSSSGVAAEAGDDDNVLEGWIVGCSKSSDATASVPLGFETIVCKMSLILRSKACRLDECPQNDVRAVATSRIVVGVWINSTFKAY